MNIALFGGSFDPVHTGHVTLAENVLRGADFIDRLYVIPAFVSPFKNDVGKNVGDEDRLEMCRLAFGDIPKVTVSDFEIKKNGISYTADTLLHFHEAFPCDRLFFIVGSDSLESLPRWNRFGLIMKLCTVIAAVRSEKDRENACKWADTVRESGEVILIDAEPFEVSSTELREKLRRGESVSGYIPEKALLYINENNLYRQ